MEQVLAPHVNFRTKTKGGNSDPGTIQIGGFKEPTTKKNLINIVFLKKKASKSIMV